MTDMRLLILVGKSTTARDDFPPNITDAALFTLGNFILSLNRAQALYSNSSVRGSGKKPIMSPPPP
jgi:hypothetical protein